MITLLRTLLSLSTHQLLSLSNKMSPIAIDSPASTPAPEATGVIASLKEAVKEAARTVGAEIAAHLPPAGAQERFRKAGIDISR